MFCFFLGAASLVIPFLCTILGGSWAVSRCVFQMNLTTRNRGYPIGPTHPWFSGGQVHLEHTPRKGLFQHIFEMCVFLALFLQSLDHVLASRAAFTHPGPGHRYLRARNVLACVHVAFVLDQRGVGGGNVPGSSRTLPCAVVTPARLRAPSDKWGYI